MVDVEIGVSFVDSGEQLKEVYKFLDDSTIEVIAKVENQFGVENLDSIVENSFGILIDRGDLSRQIPVGKIPFFNGGLSLFPKVKLNLFLSQRIY